MNRIFKKVWNRTRRCLVAVNETVKSKEGGTSSPIFIGSAILLNFIISNPAFAVYGSPEAGLVVTGKEGYFERNHVLNFGGDTTITKTGILSMVTYYDARFNISGRYTINNAGVLLYTAWTPENGGGTINMGSVNFVNTGTFAVGQYQDWWTNTGHKYTSHKVNLNLSTTFTNNGTVRHNSPINLTGGTQTNAEQWLTEGSGTLNINGGTLVNKGTVNTVGGMLVFSNGKLSNFGTVTVGENLTWGNGRYESSGGTLVTPLKNVASVGVSYETLYGVKLGSSSAATTFTSDVYADGTATINSGFKNSSTIGTGSTIRISSAVTGLQADLIRKSIQNYFPNANVTFDQITSVNPGTTFARNHAFDASVINALISAGNKNWTYYKDVWDGNLNVGTQIIGNIGFNSINGNADVERGYTLELLGTDGVQTKLAGTVNVKSGGNANFGTLSQSYINGTNGTLDVLNNFGDIKFVRGLYTVDQYLSNGSANISDSASLNIGNLQISGGKILNQGSLTISGELSFSGNAVLSSRGTVITNLDNVFSEVNSGIPDSLKYIDLSTTIPSQVKESLSQHFLKYVPGHLSESLVDHAEFTDGKVVVSGVNLTQTQVNDLTAAFKAKYPNVTIEFSGTIAGESVNSVLNTTKVNELATAGIGLDNVIYVDRDLAGENTAVVLGSSGIQSDVGFRGIADASSIDVKEGKRLVLIGTTASDPYAMTTVTTSVGSDSALELGSLGLSETHRGSMAAVNLTGGNTEVSRAKFTTVNGSYSVGDLTAQNAAVTVKSGAELTAASLSFAEDAALANEGKFTVKGALSGTADSQAQIDNYGDLSVEGDTTLYGSFTNHANAKAHLKDAYVNGTLTNAQHAFLEANDLTVKGQLVNHGEIEASDTSSVFGVLTNNGTIRLYNTEVGNRGTINNTYTLTQTGTLTVDGLLSTVAGAVSNLDDVTISGQSVNKGTFTANVLNLKSGATLVNGTIPTGRIALFSASGAKQIVNQFNLASGATADNAGSDYFGTGTIEGTYTIASTGESYLGTSVEITDGAGYTVAQSGSVVNNGRLTFGGALTNAGSITGSGVLTFAKGEDKANVFTNSGTIQSGMLAANDVTYTQTAGTLAADAGWFTNSVINQTGGTITSAALGSGNTYNLGADGSTDTAQYNLTRLTSDSTVNIRQGATLHADVIAMTGNKTTHLLGGTLATTLNQVFNDVSHQAHDINATGPNDRVDVAGPDIVTGVGTVIDSVAKGIEFGWGTVAFDDASYSAVVAADALAKLDALDADYAGKTLEVAFNGKADKEFNVDLANTVVATKNGSATFATFVNETLTNLTAANAGATSLVVGTDANLFVPESGTPNVLNDSMGFRSIVGAADGVYVNDGRHLVLVGAEEGIDLADGKVVVGGANADGTASVLTLGSYASAKPTKGHLSDVWVDVLPSAEDQGGATAVMQVRNGSFTVDTLHNGGILRIGGDGTDLAEDHTAELTVGTLTMVGASKVVNDGVLTVHGINYAADTGNHEVRNRVGATMTVENTLDLNGRLINEGTLDTQRLFLTMRGSENSGTMTVGMFTLDGNTTWGSGASARGRFVNTGDLTVTMMQNHGDFINESNATFNHLQVGDNNNRGDGYHAATYVNAGTTTTVGLNIIFSSTLTNQLNAELTASGSGQVAGTLVNEGNLTLSGSGIYRLLGNKFINSNEDEGYLINKSHLKADNQLVLLGGQLINEGTAELKDVQIVNGQLKNNSGSVIISGTTLIETAASNTPGTVAKDIVAIENSDGAQIGFADLQLKRGIIEGGTLGTVDSVGTVYADGTIRNADSVFKDLTNAGLVDVGKLTTKSSFTNSGTANLVTADVTGLVNETAGTVTVNDGTFTSAANHGTLTVTGTVAADGTSDGRVTVADNAHLTTNVGQTFESTGTLTSTGNLSSSGHLILSGESRVTQATANAGGIWESSGTTSIGTLNVAENGHFKLSGGLTHADVLTASDAVYTQTAGTFKADKGWFKDSTLNIEGGYLNAGDTRNDDGTVNGTLGHNTVNISGLNTPPSFNNEDSVESKSHFADNLTVVRADTVTSDTVINLMAGGVLDVDHLDLTESGKFNLKGGILRTSLAEIYEWVKTQAIDIKAENPETGVIEIPTQVLASTTVGSVKESIKDNMTLESGSIAFDDAYFSASTVLSSALQFGKAFGENTGITLHFLGQMQTPVTTDTVKELEDEGLDAVLAGIILDTTTLHNENAASGTTNRDLIIGGTADGANTINISIGFKDVANADKITVAGGKEFALVGSERSEDFDWTTGYTDATKFLTNAADGGHADAVDGTFTFGSDGLANSTVGWVAASDIAEKGKLLVKNGEFADWTIKNNGTVEVRRNAILHTNDYSGSGEGLNAGTFDVNGTFDVGGTFVNDGFLTAVDTPVTNVIGNLVNTKDGKAEYADMVIAEGGTSANAGNEKGENLTVNGKHTNTGTSIWNSTTVAAGGSWANGGTASGTDMTVSGDYLNVGTAEWTNETVAAGGTAKNTGKETISGTYDVAGSKTNAGEVDATGTETTRVSGSLTNEKDGKSFYDDMVIAAGGSSVNAGYEKGDILTVEGEHTNTGTSIWNNQTVVTGGSSRNEGSETLKDVLDVAGDKTNAGELDATQVASTTVSGTLTNESAGSAKYDDMVIEAGGLSSNAGTEIGDILTVKGEHNNTGSSTWNNVTLEDGGHLKNEGTLKTDKILQNGGVFEVSQGVLDAADAELAGGDFVVGNGLPLDEANKASAKLPGTTQINNRIWVIGNGELAFGKDADLLGTAVGAPVLPETPARLTVTETVTVGNGTLAVGTTTWTSENDHLTLSNGDLYFGSDSYTLVDASGLSDTKPAFKAGTDAARVFVEAGATLTLGNISEVGDYLITEGFDTTVNGTTDWTGGWTEKNLVALPDSGSGIGWNLKLNHDADKIWVTASYKDVKTVYPDIAIPDIVNDALNNGKGSSEASDDFIRGTLNDKTISIADKTHQINSVAEIGAAGGIMETAQNDSAQTLATVEERVSFAGEHFTQTGALLRETRGGSLWIDVTGGQRKTTSLKADGAMSGGHKTNAYGFVLGTDYVTTAGNTTLGAALAYSGDTVKSSGDWLSTTNKSTSWGLTGYFNRALSDRVNLIGTLSAQRTSADVDQTLIGGGFKKSAATADTTLFTAAGRAEYRWDVGGVNVIPHAGVRGTWSKTGSYDITVDGKKTFEAAPSAVTTFSLPVGVAVRGERTTASGWKVRASGDATVTAAFGDTAEKTEITAGRGVSEAVEADFLGSYSGSLNLKLQAEKGPTTVGIGLGAAVGDAGKQDYSANVNVRFVF